MGKKKPDAVERLAEALEKTCPQRGMVNNPSGKGTEPYRFPLGQSGNPNGRPPGAVSHFRIGSDRMLRSRPPRDLLADLGVAEDFTWAMAILFVLGKSALAGNTNAARILTELDMGTARQGAQVQINLNAELDVSYSEFLRRSHGLSAEAMQQVFAFMDQLPKEPVVIDETFYPDDSYREPAPEVKQLTEGEPQEEQ